MPLATPHAQPAVELVLRQVGPRGLRVQVDDPFQQAERLRILLGVDPTVTLVANSIFLPALQL